MGCNEVLGNLLLYGLFCKLDMVLFQINLEYVWICLYKSNTFSFIVDNLLKFGGEFHTKVNKVLNNLMNIYYIWELLQLESLDIRASIYHQK